MAATQPSGFDSFPSNYDRVNIIDNATYSQRKIYEKNYWLVFPNKNFLMNLGETKKLFCFLKTRGEQFGDPITPVDIANYTFFFRCYDNNGNIVVAGAAYNSDLLSGELSYQFAALDFAVGGRYFGEFQITNGASIFSLPNSNERIEIIVN